MTSIHAATYTWDTATGDSAITDGAGTWTSGAANWYDGTSYDQNWVNSTTDDVTFGGGTAGTAGTVTLGGDITIDQLVFNATNAGDYTIDLGGNTLTTGGTFLNINHVSGDTTIQNGTFHTSGGVNFILAGTGTSLTISSLITGTEVYQIGASGNLTLTNDSNSFATKLSTQNGATVSISSIKDSGVNSAAGAGTKLLLTHAGYVTYTGTGDTTNRTLELGGNSDDRLYNNGSDSASIYHAFWKTI